MSENTKTLNTRSISAIARDIRRDWGAKVNFAAKPYLQEMLYLDTPQDSCGYDSAKSIVLYFLSNASSYRGEKAKTLKKELKTLCGIK
jgi:hypothetical protein